MRHLHPSIRVVVSVALLAVATGGLRASARIAVGLEPLPQFVAPREQTADQQVAHVLSRLTFGARALDVERVRKIGVDQWIEEQLQPERVDDRETEQFFASVESYTTSMVELLRKYPLQGAVNPYFGQGGPVGSVRLDLSPDDYATYRRVFEQGLQRRKIREEVQSGRVARALMTERQLQEVLTDFWLNHFNVYTVGGGNDVTQYALAEYENQAIRPRALGHFRTLGAVAKSPAMLEYLNNWLSKAEPSRPHLPGAPRPSGELPDWMRPSHSLGLGWWGTNGASRYLPEKRPWQPFQPPPGITPELAMEVFHSERAGLNENYARELLELHTLGVDGGYTQQDVLSVARALTGWTYLDVHFGGGGFVFVPAMHDAGEKVVLGHVLPAGRGVEDREEVLDIIARHPSTARYIAFKLARRFVSDAPPPALVDRAAEVFRRTDGDIREVVRTIVTSPEFFSTAAYKSKLTSPFELVVSALRALGAPPDSTPDTAGVVARLGQPIFGHRTPDGWPETAGPWLSAGAILNRINFGTLVASGLPGVSATSWPRAETLATLPLDQQVDAVIGALLGGEASPDTRAILLRRENPLLKSAVSAKATADTIDVDQLPPLTGLAQLVALTIGSPEFQRR